MLGHCKVNACLDRPEPGAVCDSGANCHMGSTAEGEGDQTRAR